MKYKRAIFIAIIIIIMIFNFLLISGVLANNTQEDAMFSEADPVGTKIHYNSGGFEKATKAGGYPKKNKIEFKILLFKMWGMLVMSKISSSFSVLK